MNVGGFTSESNIIQRALPCFPGYAMGGIIRTGDLEIPYLEQEISNLSNKIKTLQENRERLSHDKEKQRQLVACVYQIDELKSIQEKMITKINKFIEEKKKDHFVEMMLPVDYSRSNLNYQHRSDESENMHFIIVKQQSAKSQIENFTDYLTRTHYLPTIIELIEQITQSILKQAKENQEVCLLGSFVTLSRVRVIDPIVIREDAELDAEFKNPEIAAKYSVISESVLGGVFIGFGTRISKQQEPEQEPDQDKKTIQSITSDLHTFSFVSQGAIPATENFNLWDTYNSWKKKLTSDKHCGFPVAFKVRSLLDVLKENGKI